MTKVKNQETKAVSNPDKYEFFIDGSIYKNRQLIAERPTYEQKCWVLYRLNHPETWPNIQENKIGDWRNWK